MTEQQASDLNRSADPTTGAPQPPAADQQKDEPFGTSPQTSAQAGSSSRAAGDNGQPPRSIETDDTEGAARMQHSAAPPHDAGVPTPGEAPGVSVPSVQAAAQTSEESPAVDGVKIMSLAPPGKPDGEVDTRA